MVLLQSTEQGAKREGTLMTWGMTGPLGAAAGCDKAILSAKVGAVSKSAVLP